MNLSPLLDAVADAQVDQGYGPVAVEVPSVSWGTAVRLARVELGCDWFDFLTAVDEPDSIVAVCHLARRDPFGHLLLRARLSREDPVVESVASVFAGAAWHERETAEMFGLRFVSGTGEPLELEPLLLPPGFSGHPLRKDFVLQARLDRPWPGARDRGQR